MQPLISLSLSFTTATIRTVWVKSSLRWLWWSCRGKWRCCNSATADTWTNFWAWRTRSASCDRATCWTRSDYSCWRGWGAQSATIEYVQLILDDTLLFLFVETVYWLSLVSCAVSQAYMQTGVAVSDAGETVAIIYEEDDTAYLYTPLNERLWGPTGCELLVFLCPSAAKCAKIITLWIISLS